MRELARAAAGARVHLRDSLTPEVWVNGDDTQLRQVVLNLVVNAGEAMAGTGGRIEVITRFVELESEDIVTLQGAPDLGPGRYVMLEVADDGPGMKEETRRRVFEPFFSTKLSGRGLGLAAVLGIVRAHGGGIGVESRPGTGTRFRVVLPSAAPDLDPRPATSRPGTVAGRLGRVLVIDDQEPVLELARELLGRAGYQAETALGGREGLARYRANPGGFDAVVLDLAMPDLDGAKVGRQLRRLRPDLPLLLVSGFSPDLAADTLTALEPVGFLRKPYGAEALTAALAELLGRAWKTKEVPAIDR
jgi:CheY-like chemotaxis protein